MGPGVSLSQANQRVLRVARFTERELDKCCAARCQRLQTAWEGLTPGNAAISPADPSPARGKAGKTLSLAVESKTGLPAHRGPVQEFPVWRPAHLLRTAAAGAAAGLISEGFCVCAAKITFELAHQLCQIGRRVCAVALTAKQVAINTAYFISSHYAFRDRFIRLSFPCSTRHASSSEVTQSAVPPSINESTTMSQSGRCP